MTKIQQAGKTTTKDIKRTENQSLIYHPHSSDGLILDKLAQLDHPPHPKQPPTNLKRKARRVYFSKRLALELSQLDTPLREQYLRTVESCSTLIVQEGKKLISKYCNNRWCTTCNNIRTAKLINGYEPVVAKMNEPYFVTLTRVTVNRSELKDAINGRIKSLTKVIRSIRRKGIACNGIRKLECTYNIEEDKYHPHFHLIVDGYDIAQTIVKKWILETRNQNIKIDEQGQHIRPVDDDTLKELFKYTTKLVAKDRSLCLPALDHIFQCMYGKRTFQPFGNVRMIKEDIDEIQSQEYDIEPVETAIYQWRVNDWFCMMSGRCLSGYMPSDNMHRLFEKMVT
jgi:hypothetical protein